MAASAPSPVTTTNHNPRPPLTTPLGCPTRQEQRVVVRHCLFNNTTASSPVGDGCHGPTNIDDRHTAPNARPSPRQSPSSPINGNSPHPHPLAPIAHKQGGKPDAVQPQPTTTSPTPTTTTWPPTPIAHYHVNEPPQRDDTTTAAPPYKQQQRHEEATRKRLRDATTTGRRRRHHPHHTTKTRHDDA
ncbi:hypothetical protein K443DRAFT_15552 [Laccaria amethystina LaAM-08-1]|uniref:Uncharacterized protein n=1 Tax=Laccaria amethystina LaAM-08-1 TaxID=1095629 RepID=A0A0C9X0H7_9AGAR|nr:hypothetical protein K443DRAFT_15552 [Laccaria amethystina LaAM-08-1]